MRLGENPPTTNSQMGQNPPTSFPIFWLGDAAEEVAGGGAFALAYRITRTQI